MSKAVRKFRRRERALAKGKDNFKEEILRGCLHEAGHCVVAATLRFPVKAMVLEVKRGLPNLVYFIGHSEFSGIDEMIGNPEMREKGIRAAMSVTMAGPITDGTIFGFGDGWPRGGRHDVEGVIQLIHLLPDVEGRLDIANDQTKLAQTILTENWEGVKQLAYELAARMEKGQNPGRLDGPEIQRILAEFELFHNSPQALIDHHLQ